MTISCLIFAQTGCTTLASKDNSTKSDRLPANNADIVMLVGAERTPENIQSEESVGRLVMSLQRNFQYCYEKELHSNPSLSTELLFYFGVTQKGIIHHITSEAISSVGNSIPLSQCLSSAISRARAPSLSQDLTFRARLRFQTAR